MASINPAATVEVSEAATIAPEWISGAAALAVAPGEPSEAFRRVRWDALQRDVLREGATFRIQARATGETVYITCGPFECTESASSPPDPPDLGSRTAATCDAWDPTLELDVGWIENQPTYEERRGSGPRVAVHRGPRLLRRAQLSGRPQRPEPEHRRAGRRGGIATDAAGDAGFGAEGVPPEPLRAGNLLPVRRILRECSPARGVLPSADGQQLPRRRELSERLFRVVRPAREFGDLGKHPLGGVHRVELPGEDLRRERRGGRVPSLR